MRSTEWHWTHPGHQFLAGAIGQQRSISIVVGGHAQDRGENRHQKDSTHFPILNEESRSRSTS